MQIETANTRSDDKIVDVIQNLVSSSDLNLFVDYFPDGVLLMDQDNTVIFINSQAHHLNNLGDRVLVGKPLGKFLEASVLNQEDSFGLSLAQNRREFLLSTSEGRTVLATSRLIRGSNKESPMKLVILRDLQLIDHQRRVAAGQGESNVFRFLSDQDGGPDFESQRRISPAVDKILQAGYRALNQGARLLLTGESGSGKTEIARYLHRIAGTAEEPFVHVNCGAIPDSLFESEMFGYEKGAFTDALRTGKQGLIESAEGGTLFLDEVGEIPLTSQAKLLKFLEDGVVQRVGGRTGRKIKMRVVSATNRDLWKLVDEKLFRNDLYYRLAVINLEVMPLREQPALIRHLIDYFITMTNRMRQVPLTLSDECYDNLCTYHYHGNIRELHNLIQHLSVIANDIGKVGDLPIHMQKSGADESHSSDREVNFESGDKRRFGLAVADSKNLPLKQQVKEFESGIINRAIQEFGTKRKAARALGVDIGTIVRKTKR